MTITIANNNPRIAYTATASQTAFTVPFEFFDASDLNVFINETLKTITTHYTVSGGNGSTGTVTLTSGATVNDKILITRDVTLERTTDFPTSGPFQVASLNTELDKIIAMMADLNDLAGRGIQLADSDTAVSVILPNVTGRAGKVLAFNSSTGAVEAGPTITDTQTVAQISADISTVAGIQANVTTVAGISSNVSAVGPIAANVTTVAGIQANVTTVAGISANVTTVAGIASAVQSVAAVASLITADFQSDLNTLATSDIVADLNILATTDVVSDLAQLATTDFVSDLNSVATTTVINNIATVAGANSNITTVAGSIANINTVGSAISNVNSVGGSIANVNTVASNLSGVNSFAERYQVGSTDPTSSLDSGDLFFNTSTNQLKYYSGSAWTTIIPSTAAPAIEDSGGTPVLASGITDAEIRTLIGAGTSSFDGAYGSLTGTPTIPSNVSDLTNDSGFITSADGGNAATLDSLDSTQFLRSDADDTSTGNLTIQKDAPKLVLDSSSSGSTTNEQSATISLGESGTGGAALHLAYTGDGYSYIGMGSLGADNIPDNRAMRLFYTNDNVHFYDSLTCAGNITAYSSDRRLKENIKTIESGLDKICRLRGVTFDWKDGLEELGFSPEMKTETGLIAQELQEVMPDAVVPAPFDHDNNGSISGENYLTVKPEKIIPVLIEAIKEQQTQIEGQQKQIDELTQLIKVR